MQQKSYPRYKRGQIVLVNFSPSMGSETKNKHFAIVLTKDDTVKNGVLTVIPLTSKNKSYYLDLGNLIQEKATAYLDNETTQLLKDSKDCVNSIIDKNELTEEEKKEIEPRLKDMLTRQNDLKKALSLYSNKNQGTYAIVKSITTISKLRVQRPFRTIDPIKNMYADAEHLDLIDTAIINNFTAKTTISTENTKKITEKEKSIA